MAAHDSSTIAGAVMVLALACGSGCCASAASAQAGEPRAGSGSASAASAGGAREPTGRAITALEPARCRELLRDAGVDFRPYEGEHADAIEAPIVLEGAIGGVTIEHAGGSKVHGLIDCRLAVALLRWAPTLRAAGVVRIEHFSVFRPGARVRGEGTPSAHAAGLAVDAGRFHFDDGRQLDVEEAWVNRDGEPCPEREDETPGDNRVLRSLVCWTVAQDLFQVVITPHHNERHSNHVHLELVADVDWSYVR